MKVIDPTYQFLTQFIENLPNDFQSQGTVLYKERNEVRLIEVDGIKVVVKKFKVPHFINRIAYTFFRKSKARRSYEFGNILCEKGVETPHPIAYIEQLKFGLLHESYYICLECPYSRLMREFWKGDISGREDIIVKFARFSAKLHNAGVYHVDFSPGNILFEKIGDSVQFSIIDINRMKFQHISEELGYKNFERLWINDEAYKLLAIEYARLRGFDRQKAIERIIFWNNKFMKSRKIKK
ncbi:MAG: lipopolysaccharide kinase InaA family protein [Bacteroidales bacterium]|nr:lipopolysaccharide kinase InaA family protein [Bacteroidales bacterium]